jgi:hypothetical protein
MSVLPDWNSIESTSRWSDILFWAGILCLILLAVAEIGSHIYGSRSSFLVGEAARLAEIQRSADEAAAKKKSDDEAAQLRGQLAKAEKVATEAGEKVAELDRLRAPRHLLPAQQKALRDLLAGAPKLQVAIFAGTASGDEKGYADELASVFRALSWDVRVVDALFTGSDTSGLWLVMNGTQGQTVPEGPTILLRALVAAGLDIRPSISGSTLVPEGEIQLNIGRKK